MILALSTDWVKNDSNKIGVASVLWDVSRKNDMCYELLQLANIKELKENLRYSNWSLLQTELECVSKHSLLTANRSYLSKAIRNMLEECL